MKQLYIPAAELISVRGHDYSMRPIKQQLGQTNATLYGKAVDRVKASEQGIEPSGQAGHIIEGSKIAKVGNSVLTIGLFDNKTAEPELPNSLVGFIQPGFERVTYCQDGVSHELHAMCTTLGTGPWLAQNSEFLRGDRIQIKIKLIEFALKTFIDFRASSPIQTQVRVSPRKTDIELGIALAELGGKKQNIITSTKDETGQLKAGRAMALPLVSATWATPTI